jgi:hypothetical protein
MNADWSCILPPMALMYRWGHMSSIEAIVDERLSALRRCIDEPEDSEKEQMHTLLGPSLMINTLHATGFAYLHDKAAALLVDAGLTYSAADTTFVGHSLAWLRPVGDKSLNVSAPEPIRTPQLLSFLLEELTVRSFTLGTGSFQ